MSSDDLRPDFSDLRPSPDINASLPPVRSIAEDCIRIDFPNSGVWPMLTSASIVYLIFRMINSAITPTIIQKIHFSVECRAIPSLWYFPFFTNTESRVAI